MASSTRSSKARKEDADARSSAPSSGFHRSSSFKPLFSSILETSHEETSAVTTSSRMRADGESSRVSSSSRTREENERLKAELEKLKRASSSGVSVPSTSSKTRLEMEALKKELADMKASARTSRLREINKMVRAVQELDLAFVFDATSSMDRYMEVVKDKILKIAHGISDAYPESLIRVAFVFYRDYNDNESCGSCDFTINFCGSLSTFVQALAQVEAKGGGDTAEDVFSGLETLAKLKWTSHNRVVYHIADAPCHGTRFHESNVSDNYPKGDLKGRDITTLLRTLREDCKLSNYTFLHINQHTRKMLREFKEAAGLDSTWIREDKFEDMDIEDIPAKVVTACTSTISHSLSTMTSARMQMVNVKFVPRQVRTEMPGWDDIKAQEGKVYKFKRYGNVEEVLRHIEGGVPLELEKTQSVQVQVGLYPFSGDGASRWPFYAQIVTHEYDTKVMVVKRFKDKLGGDTAKLHTMEKYKEQMEVQVVSAHLAEDFNHCISHISEARKVSFTNVTTLEVQSMYYNMEKVLTGLWTKFNNNAGYVNDVGSYTDTLQAFSHWTHQRSEGMVMVTDLQGIQMSSVGTGAFLLCDPAIHSRDVLRFTRTNLGEKGFELFYKSHKCNIICRKLGLKPSTHTP